MTTTTAIDIDHTLSEVVAIKQQIKALEGLLNGHLDNLRQAVDAGDLDPTFTHDDTQFDLRSGRVSYDYPAEVVAISQALKLAQADAVANGTAILKRGEPYWQVKLPKS